MGERFLIRSVSVFTLAVTLSIISIPLPAQAADDESPPPRVLTVNGHALSQLLNRTAPGDPLLLAGLLEQETGRISGVALDGEGQPLADHTVQLKRISRVAEERSEQMSDTATTDEDGRFSFTGLPASEYVVEVHSGDEIIASASATLADGAMQVSGVVASSAVVDSDPGESWASRHRVISAVAGTAVFVAFIGLWCYLACDEPL